MKALHCIALFGVVAVSAFAGIGVLYVSQLNGSLGLIQPAEGGPNYGPAPHRK